MEAVTSTDPSMPSRHPAWIRVRLPGGPVYSHLKEKLDQLGLKTVCRQALCPNLSECWGQGTATFLALGDMCTRHCRFCAVGKGVPQSPDPEEPGQIAQAVSSLKLRHVVITSVTRDDLRDGGAAHIASIVGAVRERNTGCTIEVLIPDFKGNQDDLGIVISADPEILGHNIETVPRLYPEVRPQASYRQSLELLERVKARGLKGKTKSGLMVGFGETQDEILKVMHDLFLQRVDIFTLGQYLQPTRTHLPVVRYYTPDEFTELGTMARRIGFAQVEAGPLVRSSYHAARQV